MMHNNTTALRSMERKEAMSDVSTPNANIVGDALKVEGSHELQSPWCDLLTLSGDQSADEEALLARLFVDVVRTGYNVLSLKTYRLELPTLLGVPITPCLDHEAQIHEHELPHLGGYLQHWDSGSMISFAYFPLKREIWIEEEVEDSHQELEELAVFFRTRFPLHQVRTLRMRPGSAYTRARDVAEAHLPLLSVLLGDGYDDLQAQLHRLNGIATLMEKQSRVSSWGIRTTYPPLMAALAFVLVLLFPSHGATLSAWTAGDWFRVFLLLFSGGLFLYYGLKAVQLTKTATRLNKRIREYEFILAAQQRIREGKGNLCVQRNEACVSTLNESGQAAYQKALSLLEESAHDVERIARLVKCYHLSAAAVQHAPLDEKPPLFREISRIRLAVMQAQQETIEQALSKVEHKCHKPQHIATRATQRKRLSILQQKSACLQSILADGLAAR